MSPKVGSGWSTVHRWWWRAVRRTHEGGLGHTGCNEERNTGPDTPLADQFVEQEHEVRTGEELRHDDEVGPAETVGVEATRWGRGTRVCGMDSIGIMMRTKLLNTLVHGLVFGVAEVQTDDRHQQLHDN